MDFQKLFEIVLVSAVHPPKISGTDSEAESSGVEKSSELVRWENDGGQTTLSNEIGSIYGRLYLGETEDEDETPYFYKMGKRL